MDEPLAIEQPGPAPAAPGPLRSMRSRRAFLGGAAGIAAAGTAAAIVYATGVTGDEGGSTGATGADGDDESTASPGSASPAPEVVDTIIADPRRRAAHLLRRAGFGGNAREIDEFAKLTREEAADRLLNFESVDNTALNARVAAGSFELTDYTAGLMIDMQRWWMTRMAYTARPLEERMTYIWHGLLTSQSSKIGPQRSKLMVRQNELFRSMPLPKYDDLLKAISRDPAMLIYLDNVESSKEHPNENYARELMELYSMGVGNYTEDDVRESARAFTGWRITNERRPPANNGVPLTDEERKEALRQASIAYNPTFFVDEKQHDSGTKTFLGQTGNFGGDEIIDIIMKQGATGRYICTRLFQEFVRYEPDQPTVEGLVKTWDSTGHDVKAVVRQILVSDAFYSERSYRSFVRAPVEYVVGLVRALEIDTDFRLATNRQVGVQSMDQILFEPPSVAGWPGGATWMSSTTFFGRVNFLDAFLFGVPVAQLRQASQGQPANQNRRAPVPIPMPAIASATTVEAAVDAALAVMLDANPASGLRDAIVSHVQGVPRADRDATIAYLVAASPEFQLA